MKIKTYKKTIFSNSRKSKTEKYLFKNKFGEFETSVSTGGNFKGFSSDIEYSEIDNDNVPQQAWDDYYSFCQFATEDEGSQWVAQNEKLQKEKENKQLLEQNKLNLIDNFPSDLSGINFDDLKDKIKEVLEDRKEIDEVFFEIHFKTKRYQDGYGVDSGFWLDLQNKNAGLKFKITLADGRDYDVDNALSKFEFVFRVIQLGAKVKNKGIITALSKKQSRPNIQTLKKEGFKISNQELQVLDFNKVEDIDKLFKTYER